MSQIPKAKPPTLGVACVIVVVEIDGVNILAAVVALLAGVAKLNCGAAAAACTFGDGLKLKFNLVDAFVGGVIIGILVADVDDPRGVIPRPKPKFGFAGCGVTPALLSPLAN